MLQAQRLPRMTAFFLITTVLTSATGFLFPFVKLLPSHILAVLSLIVLAIAIYALSTAASSPVVGERRTSSRRLSLSTSTSSC